MKIESCGRPFPNHWNVPAFDWTWWNLTKETIFKVGPAGVTTWPDKAFCGGKCRLEGMEWDFILLCPDCLKLNGIVW